MLLISSIYSTFSSLIGSAPAGLILSLSAIGIDGGKFANSWKVEFIGTLVMIFLTFSPGKWVGVENETVSWAWHAAGVIAADYISGGPHVNPMVSVTMYALNKCSYSEMLARIAGAMAGGLVAFPLYLRFSDSMGLQPLGGPAFDGEKASEEETDTAFLSEFLAAFLLMIAIYALNWEMNFGKNHYWIKQFLTAVVIRYLIVVFPAAGPAINPMLGTTWAVFASGKGELPADTIHYLIYWVASILGGIASAVVYVVYAGGTVLGHKLPFGPIKKVEKAESGGKGKKKKA